MNHSMREYTVVYERGEGNWSAYSPDVPGCVAAADTREEVEKLFAEALESHIAALQQDGLPVREPTTDVGRMAVDV